MYNSFLVTLSALFSLHLDSELKYPLLRMNYNYAIVSQAPDAHGTISWVF